jgi:hypothetical protein
VKSSKKPAKLIKSGPMPVPPDVTKGLACAAQANIGRPAYATGGAAKTKAK